MSITGLRVPGGRLVIFELDPRTALDVFFHLASSMHCEETTDASRIHVAALLPALRRALVQTGIVRGETLDELQAHLMRKPAPPSIDAAIRALSGDAQMVLKKAFMSGHSLVVSLPKKYAEALRIVPGTQLVLSIQNRAIHISRGVITPESMHAPEPPAPVSGADTSEAE